jgi:Caspase domain
MLQEFNSGETGPKTHVLLIGVGGYPYLKDGDQAKPQSPELQDLGQLTSPIASVASMYNKMMEYNTKNVWSKKLGSIEILLSPPPGLASVLPLLNIENANLANIQKAYFSWKGRCDKDEDNVALFYYCGHGFQKKYHFLLADDFGAFPQNPWLGAFNFDDTRDAFYSCKAKTPIFFVDACRQVTIEMLKNDLTVAPIENPSLFNPEESKNHLTLKATASGQSAYGKKNQPTYFAQAVISGLDGLVAKQDEYDDWLIDTGGLSSNIYNLLDLINPEQSFKQRCQIECGLPSDIIKRKDAPIARLEVSCSPVQAVSHAELTCIEDEDTAIQSGIPMPKDNKWEFDIKAATYKVAATFKAGSKFTNCTKKASLIPPIKKVNLNCS